MNKNVISLSLSAILCGTLLVQTHSHDYESALYKAEMAAVENSVDSAIYKEVTMYKNFDNLLNELKAADEKGLTKITVDKNIIDVEFVGYEKSLSNDDGFDHPRYGYMMASEIEGMQELVIKVFDILAEYGDVIEDYEWDMLTTGDSIIITIQEEV